MAGTPWTSIEWTAFGAVLSGAGTVAGALAVIGAAYQGSPLGGLRTDLPRGGTGGLRSQTALQGSPVCQDLGHETAKCRTPYPCGRLCP